jgi:excinuclease UvrABC nuclease subunit
MARFQFDAQCYPDEPGCYLIKGEAGEVLYVGKAKNLRRRLASYFRSRSRDWRARRLVARALTIANGSPIRITIPQSGIAYELLKLCERNYEYRVSWRGCG